tara:strand:+ start:1320 stop:2267 length:948 start_codon:yes stop_codon:yes gene_type:complete
MSTQSIKNIISSQLDSVLIRAKQKIKDEGKKKIVELKQQIPTPQQLTQKLKVDINEDSCSPKGIDKFQDKFKAIEDKLKIIENQASSALDTLKIPEEKLNDILNAADSGPIGKIKSTEENLGGIVQIFEYIITLSPLLFLANSGPTNSGATQDQITEKRNTAKSKVGEYLALFATIPLMILYFQDQAQKTLDPLNLLKAKIQFIKNEVIKLRLFIAGLYLTYEQRCDSFNNGDDDSGGNTTTGELSDLNKLLQLLEEQYDDVFQQLSQSSNLIALQRIYHINDNLERDYDISFKTINPSLGEGSEYPGTSPQLPD